MLNSHPELPTKLGILQSLDDAIAFRLNRLQSPCNDCTSDGKCDEHACDVLLVERYREKSEPLLRELLDWMDPEDIALVMQSGEDLPPTAIVFTVAMMGQLRSLASDGIPAPGSDDAKAATLVFYPGANAE